MTFPTTSVLDDFNRSDTGPPPSASWTTPSFRTGMQVISNQVGGTALFNWATWNVATYGPNSEVYATLAQRNGGGRFEFFIRAADVDINGLNYNLTCTWSGSVWAAQLYDSNYDPIGTSHNLSIGDGDAVGLSADGNTLTVYEKVSGVWSSVFSLTDSSVTGAGYIGLQTDNLVRLDDFGGGTTTSGSPIANFTGTPTSGFRPLTVNFTDSSSGSFSTWAWNFGDGNTSSIQNPTNVYTSAGTYSVSLTVDGTSGSSNLTRTNYISVSSTSANFTGTPVSGAIPLTVNFTDASTGSGLSSWSWNFGDSGTSTSQNPSHVYSSVGTYSVSLTVDGASGSSSFTRTNYITATLPAPTALFTANPSTGLAPLDVSFTDNSTGTITSWAWNFGDGNTSSEQNPLHRYRFPGTYSVSLTVANVNSSGSITIPNLISVSEVAGPTPPTPTPEPAQHVSGTINGNQIAGYVRSLRRVGHICAPGQHATLVMSPDWPHGVRPGRMVFLYENDEQVMKGFVIRVTRSRPSHDWVIEIDDTYTLVTSTFLDTPEATTAGHDTAYWAAYILEKCGATYSINGIPAAVPEGVQIGLRSAAEALKDIITYASWYAWADKTGKIQIGRFDRSISARTVTEFTQFEYDISDDMTRNVIKAYGTGRIFAVASRHVPGIVPDRIAVVGSPLIKTYAEAQRVADYMIGEIGDLTKIIRGTIPGNPKIKIGNVITETYVINGKRYSVTDIVTSLESNYDVDSGYTMEVSVGERCPRIAGFSSKIPWTYAGLNGNGVYVSRDKGVTWNAMNSGLPLTSKVASRVAGDSCGKSVSIINGSLWSETGTNWTQITLPSPGGVAKSVGSLGGMDSFAVLTGNRVFFSIPSSGSEPPEDPTVSSGSISGWTSVPITTVDLTSGSTLYASGIDMYCKTGTAYVNAITSSGSFDPTSGSAGGGTGTEGHYGGIISPIFFGQHINESRVVTDAGTFYGSTTLIGGAFSFTMDDTLPDNPGGGGAKTLYSGESYIAYHVTTGSSGYTNGAPVKLYAHGSISATGDAGCTVAFNLSTANDYYGTGTGVTLPQNGHGTSQIVSCTPGNTVNFIIRSPFIDSYNGSWYMDGYFGLSITDSLAVIGYGAHGTYDLSINEIEVQYSDGGWAIFLPSGGSVTSGSYNLYTVNAADSILVSDIPAVANTNDRLYVSDDGEVVLYNTDGRLLISNDFGGTWHSAYPNSAPTKVAAVTRTQTASTELITSGSYNTVIAEISSGSTNVEYQAAIETTGGWSTATAQVPSDFTAKDMIWSTLSTQGALIGGGGSLHKIYRYDPTEPTFNTLLESDTGIPSESGSDVLDLEFGE